MKDQYYNREITVIEDAREELRVLADQLMHSADSQENHQIAVDEAGIYLGGMLDAAVESGDEKTQQSIQATWDRMQYSLAVGQSNRELAVGLLAAAQSLDARASAAEDELSLITDALAGEGQHPIVEAFTDNLVEEIYEYEASSSYDYQMNELLGWGLDSSSASTILMLSEADSEWTHGDIDHLIEQLQAMKARYPEPST